MSGQVVLGALGLKEGRAQHVRVFGVVVIIVIDIVVVEVIAAENGGMQSLPAPCPGLARTRSRAGSIVVTEKRRAQMRRSAGRGTPDRLVVVFVAEKRRAKLAFALVGFGTSRGVIEVVQVIVLGAQKRRAQTAPLGGFSICLGARTNVLEFVFFLRASQNGRVEFDLFLFRFACRTRGTRLGLGNRLSRSWSGC